jgi:hypothetical protein
VEKAMDDIADAVADAQAMSNLLAENLGVAGSVDLSDEAIEAELNQLVTERTVVKPIEPKIILPAVPDHPVEIIRAVPDHPVAEVRATERESAATAA